MVERIPKEVLDRAARSLARQVASVILQAMSQVDMSFEDVDGRLDRRHGYTKKRVLWLAEGRGRRVGLSILAECAWALGVDFTMKITPMERANGRDGGRGQSDNEEAGTAATGDDGASPG